MVRSLQVTRGRPKRNYYFWVMVGLSEPAPVPTMCQSLDAKLLRQKMPCQPCGRLIKALLGAEQNISFQDGELGRHTCPAGEGYY